MSSGVSIISAILSPRRAAQSRQTESPRASAKAKQRQSDRCEGQRKLEASLSHQTIFKMHLPDGNTHFDQDRQREEAREQPQYKRNAAEKFRSGGKIRHPWRQPERRDHIHVMVKSFEYLAIAMRDKDRPQRKPHDKLRERLKAVQEIEIQAHLRE